MATHMAAAESTGNVLAGSRVRDVSKKIHEVDPDAAPFTLFFSKADSAVADNPKFEWQEKGLPERWDIVDDGSGVDTTTTTIGVEHGSYFHAGDIIQIPRTGEKMRVASISSNTLTVVRAYDGDGTTGSAINDNDDVHIIGTAFAENADVGTPYSYQETQPYNYTQIFRRPFGASRTLTKSRLYSGNTRTRQGMENARDFRIQMELSFLFGERNEFSGTGNQPIRISGGILSYLTSNNQAMGATMTEVELESWFQDVFNATGGGTERYVAASGTAITIIDQLAAARLQVVPREKTYGVAITRLVTGHGEASLIKHRLLESNSITADGYDGYMIAVDPKKIGYRYLADSDIKLYKDRQTNGTDGWIDEYLAEVGWEIRNPQVHGVATGIIG